MRRLFCLATSKFTIYWDRVRDRDHAIWLVHCHVLGRLQILNVASTVQVLETTTRVMFHRIAADLDIQVTATLRTDRLSILRPFQELR